MTRPHMRRSYMGTLGSVWRPSPNAPADRQPMRLRAGVRRPPGPARLTAIAACSPVRGDRPPHTTAILIRRATDVSPSRCRASRAGAILSSRLVLTPELFTRSRLDPCERLSGRRRKLRMGVKIVVPRVDGTLKDQVPDRSAQRRAASCRHNGVALRYDQGGGHEGAADKLDRGHAIAEEQPDRSPPVEITSHGFERVEGHDQHQPRNRSMPGEICGDRSADAEADWG